MGVVSPRRNAFLVSTLAATAWLGCGSGSTSHGTRSPAETQSATSSPAADGSASREKRADSHRTVYRSIPDSEKARALARFQALNGAAWKHLSHAQFDAFHPIPVRMVRADKPGPAAALDDRAVESRARAFVDKNAETFALTHEQVAALKSEVVHTVPPHSHGVRLTGAFPQKGYDAFRSVDQEISVWVDVDVDGEIRDFTSHVQPHHVGLDLDPSPKIPPDSPRLKSKVVGTPVFRYRPNPKSVAVYSTTWFRKALGPIAESDIVSVRPEIIQRLDFSTDGAMATYTLVYEVRASKEGLTFTFDLDASSGEILVKPEPPAGATGLTDE
jgi:hypothetical protein